MSFLTKVGQGATVRGCGQGVYEVSLPPLPPRTFVDVEVAGSAVFISTGNPSAAADELGINFDRQGTPGVPSSALGINDHATFIRPGPFKSIRFVNHSTVATLGPNPVYVSDYPGFFALGSRV